jgi:hypothetical protein
MLELILRQITQRLSGATATDAGIRLLRSSLDDRFHESGLDEARLHGTGITLVDSLFEKS